MADLIAPDADRVQVIHHIGGGQRITLCSLVCPLVV
jgi:hypothetical protein